MDKKKVKFVLLCFFLLIKSIAWTEAGGTLIPFYIYPTSDAIQPLLDAKTLHPNVSMRVIMNPDSGPGSTQDPIYVDAITALQLAGIEIAGYVDTNNNARPIEDVMTDIAAWDALYGVDGIFLDSMGTATTYYSSLTTYIHSLGMDFSIGNVGGLVSTGYTSLVDTVVIATTDALPLLTDYASWQAANVPKITAAMLISDISSFPSGFIYEANQFVGWIYVTDGGGTDPWSVLPSYFNLLMSALDKVDVGTIFPFYIYPTQEAIQPLIDIANQYPNVPIWAIMDPANGPGTSIDPTYIDAMAQLRAAGIILLGYVNTNYGQRAKSLVNTDIRRWVNWYQPDGIFLDLMSIKHAYYSSITAYAKSLGIQMVNGNPGTNINASAGADVDITTIFENSYLPTPLSQFQNWYNVYPSPKLSLISYNIPTLPTSFITSASEHFGWLFISDQPGPDPYEAYPSYFNDFIQLLSTQ